jgi:hypothetical protein
MTDETTRHIVDEELSEPASYLTVRKGDRVYDLYGWAAGRVAEMRIAPTRDEFFDGVVVDFRGRHLFIDAPEVKSIHDGLVLLGVSVADMSRAERGQCQVPPRAESEDAAPDDAVALMASLSRMYVADRLSLTAMEQALERVLSARTCGDLDAIAAELLAGIRRRATSARDGGSQA